LDGLKIYLKKLKITAKDSEGNIMAFEHAKLNVSAVQFHPESIFIRIRKRDYKKIG
jgi:anthranilate/para-aminobenzoate synthase component II